MNYLRHVQRQREKEQRKQKLKAMQTQQASNEGTYQDIPTNQPIRLDQLIQDKYLEGVRAGVEKASLFTKSCFERAIANTKGIGDVKRKQIEDAAIANFNTNHEFGAYSTYESQEMFRLRLMTHGDEATLKRLQAICDTVTATTNVLLTVDDLLSTIETFTQSEANCTLLLAKESLNSSEKEGR